MTGGSVYLLASGHIGSVALWIVFLLGLFLLAVFGVTGLSNGYGDLILTPEGFKTRALFNKQPIDYSWNDILGFYVTHVSASGHSFFTKEKVCFDLATIKGDGRRRVLANNSDEALTPHQLAALMNRWKETYAPNPEGVVLRPLEGKPISFAKAMGIEVLGPALLIILLLGCYFLFSKTTLTVINNTPDSIHAIHITALSPLPRTVQAFQVSQLQARQQAKIVISHFDAGMVLVDYHDKTGQKIAYLKHDHCVWHDGEKIFIEPGGHVEGEIQFCKTKHGEIDNLLVRHIPAHNWKKMQQHAVTKKVILVSPEVLAPSSLPQETNKPDYALIIAQEVQRHWHPPFSMGPLLNGKVTFHIQRDGIITEVTLVESTGDKTMDESMLSAIRYSSPLPTRSGKIPEASHAVDFTFNISNKK